MVYNLKIKKVVSGRGGEQFVSESFLTVENVDKWKEENPGVDFEIVEETN
jgi:hypothetical protein